MLADLEALIPPLIVGGAFAAGVIWFLRRQMGTPRAPADDGGRADISGGDINADPPDPAPGSSADQQKV